MGLKIVEIDPGERAAQRISLCMIMRDEEEHLARCLDSVRDVVDEIVIVDTGSVDRSVEIAEGYGARILREEWRDDFAAPRNTALDAATGDWVLVLDADEELIDGRALRDLVEQPGVEGYSLREVNYVGEERGVDAVVMSAFRLFRNRPDYRYSGALHEQVMTKVTESGRGTTPFVGVEIHHYGYLDGATQAKQKLERNMAIVMDEVRRRPRDSFTLFNAGVEFQRAGRHEEALDHFRRSFSTLDTLSAYYASLLVRNIVATLHALDRDDEALEVLVDGLQAYPDFADLHHLEGRILAARREYRGAVRSFRRAIEFGDHLGDRYLAQSGMGSFYSLASLGALHRMMGDNREAVRCLKRAIESADGYFPAPIPMLTRILLDTDPPDVVREYMSRLVSERRRGDSLCLIAGVLLEAGHPEEARVALHEARACGADEGLVRLALAGAGMRMGDHAQASAELAAVGGTGLTARRAAALRVLIAVIDGETDTARAALADLDDPDDRGRVAAYRMVVDAHDGVEPTVPDLDAAGRRELLDTLFTIARQFIELGHLEPFNRVTPMLYAAAAGPGEVDERLGLLLFEHAFLDPAAERLMAAVSAGDASPDAIATLGRICAERDMPEDAETFLTEALDRDRENISRYLDLAGLLVGAGRYDDAGVILRDGLVMHPHSTVLAELRQSMSMLAAGA